MKKADLKETANTTLRTPIGALRLSATSRGLSRLEFSEVRAQGSESNGHRAALPAARRHLAAAARQLREYFAGRRSKFTVPLDLSGTKLQANVWRGLLGIPYGATSSYGELARRVGRPRAARAVGRACGDNPLPVIVPCHRVIGSDGALHGYGGGLWRKRLLLELEGVKVE